MKFDYVDKHHREPYPSTDQSHFTQKPRSLTYHEFVDLVKYLWEKGHPDIEFIPINGLAIADAQKGYIAYKLESRSPTKDFPKPRIKEYIKDTETGKDVQVSIQVFENLISFTSIHKDPRVAEEIIEAFEDFMIEFTPVFHENGISNLFYYRRYPDSEDARIGQDMNARKVSYMLLLEKTLLSSYDRINEMIIDVRVFRRQYVQKATPDLDIDVIINDSFATPNYS